jgi:hypothetical protein
MLTNCEEIIEALGGTGEVAEYCGTTASTVSSWKARKSIPAERWLDLVDLARRRDVNGITLETLATLHSRLHSRRCRLCGGPLPIEKVHG